MLAWPYQDIVSQAMVLEVMVREAKVTVNEAKEKNMLGKKTSPLQPVLYLASQSPRRAELLQQIGLPFEKLCIEIDEQLNPHELPDAFVSRLAYEKAIAGWRALFDSNRAPQALSQAGLTDPLASSSNTGLNSEFGLKSHKLKLSRSDNNLAAVVLAADTIVICDDVILGKPSSEADAQQMLQALSGRSHWVYTGVSVLTTADSTDSAQLQAPYAVFSAISKTRVVFRTIQQAEVQWYWSTGEPCDKAGGYGIQGLGAIFVQAIEGSYTGVVGLPLFETCELLRQVGIYPGRV